MAVDRTGIKWSREEIILAFDLYCRTPFGKISQGNPEIIKLAQLLGRTPGSVGLKMHNLAHHDPELQKRNVTAMAHGSKLDGEIFSEFSRDWTSLSYQAQLIRAKMQNKDISEVIDLGDIDLIPAGKYRDHMMKTRVGQYFFRMASHIEPWKVSDERTERTNPTNGLCLNSLHDKAFDRGLITLDKNYKIIVSRKLKDTDMDSETKSWFMGYDDHQIILPDKFMPGKDFIEYHNDVIFQR